jgi:hypothetical protein
MLPGLKVQKLFRSIHCSLEKKREPEENKDTSLKTSPRVCRQKKTQLILFFFNTKNNVRKSGRGFVLQRQKIPGANLQQIRAHER